MVEIAAHGLDPAQQSSPLETDPTAPSPSHRRTSALDGIRGFAVAAVIAYHGGVSWIGGGLLGVDVFFVLSGFLITSLLCRELVRTHTIELARFWAQRARRLLPALFVTIIGVAVYVHVFEGSYDLSSVRGDALATLAYVSNWHFILSDQGYFTQTAAVSPFLHTWSLAVEEQYYLVWPLVALAVTRLWGVRKLAPVAAIGAAGSALLMGSMYVVGFSVDRLYYGTDTRAQALLIGSFLGAVGTHTGSSFDVLPASWTLTRFQRRCWTGLGTVGALFLVWAWHDLGGQSGFLYKGGFFCVALAAAAVIVTCVTFPASMLARLCSLRALVFVGRISYGLYLYHWPLFQLLDHAHTGLSGLPLLAVRLAVTFAVATVSFFLIEEPVRRRRMFRGRKGLLAAAVGVVVSASAIVLGTIPPATAAVSLKGPNGMPIGENRALGAAHAFTTEPIRFLLVGDSVALTLGEGLSAQSVRRFGVEVDDEGALGCDLDSVEVELSGAVGPATPGCLHWKQVWSQYVARYDPDVVGLLIGRWEVSDHLYDGRWVHVGEASWDEHLVSEMDQAFDIFGSKGASVVVFTMPYVDPPTEAANGQPFPENSPARAAAFNKLVVTAARQSRQKVTVIDLNRMIDPSGHFQADIDGIQVRWSDGIHITVAGGELLQPKILPVVAEQGLVARVSRGA